ncbi:threonylcarbamoyl-AMP synthase [Aminipila butyrica]|uniref:Threonylcarbamoyl-AMP synthase n=1 Tax=Aminipila butyrica TaxID=433296 RepID=A0A858BS77_9FIRM|nr:L-threonylcarbamoyladenylate synthase [Aminipila butyrica]QIB68192.1 threonylcarbamoyl-AMP synthase [Aminipila butyrica]
METKLLNITTENLQLAAQMLAAGKLVVFPTETVYGLGADAFNEEAVKKVYEAKGRPSDNPMIVHISDRAQLEQLTPQITPVMEALMEAFWPGPLTMVVKKRTGIPDATTGGLNTVGLRMPSDETARELIRLSGCPIAAPSANLSGSPSPTRPEHAAADLEGRVDAILMGGDCQVGIESTVVDVSGSQPMVLRPGIITREALAEVVRSLGMRVEMDPALFINRPRDVSGSDFKPKAPGMKYRHYAPKADMEVISGQADGVRAEINRRKLEREAAGQKVGVILFGEDQYRQAAHDFFANLRQWDDQGVDLILAGALDDADSVGFAVMNRMLKSAGYRVIQV